MPSVAQANYPFLNNDAPAGLGGRRANSRAEVRESIDVLQPGLKFRRARHASCGLASSPWSVPPAACSRKEGSRASGTYSASAQAASGGKRAKQVAVPVRMSNAGRIDDADAAESHASE